MTIAEIPIEHRKIEVWVNGEREKEIKVESQEALAANPIKYVTKSGRNLSIAFDKLAGHLSMKHQGFDAEKLPPVEQSLEIC